MCFWLALPVLIKQARFVDDRRPSDLSLDNTSITNWYQTQVDTGNLVWDEAQWQAVNALQYWGDYLVNNHHYRVRQNNWFRSKRQNNQQGLYLYGVAGRGKTFLLEFFYQQLPLKRKVRTHFHQFMQDVHIAMKNYNNRADPLLSVVGDLINQFEVICFDEFHVSDIVNAMLLGRLLDELLAEGVHLLVTSNYAPSQLYPNGLARDKFLATITLLENRLQILPIGGDKDYRLMEQISADGLYLTPWNENTHQVMKDRFRHLVSDEIVLTSPLNINNRLVEIIMRTENIIWFNFDSLCQSARSKGDYLYLANRYRVIFLSALPNLGLAHYAQASRRFTWLIDILYDQNIALVVSSDCALADLYGGLIGGESGRTQSRLYEMQGFAYYRRVTKRK